MLRNSLIFIRKCILNANDSACFVLKVQITEGHRIELQELNANSGSLGFLGAVNINQRVE